ncbi:MAG: 50S ribosomal protein L30 [Dehalococcoidia bacterium]|jgi:large subunit ribosomal protein L30|nr:50S ribosomal protein L30 [Dehalococcoidia bacterium]|tara:strand:+ start:1537 stop:1719 length:183 start_codon:yes stop_codon:yes gene_type:complete
MKKIKIIQRKSKIGASPSQRATLRALGLRKIGSVVEKDLSPQIDGMIKKVDHLISTEELK